MAAALGQREATAAIVAQPNSAAPTPAAEVTETSPATEPVLAAGDVNAMTWPDDSAEAAFLGEARERGEIVKPAKVDIKTEPEKDSRPLPALNELVERIPPEVREVLDDLFRAKFTTVRRVPRQAFKD
jgi:hypothetical protein